MEGGDDLPPGMRVNMYGHVEPVILGTSDWDKRWERKTVSFHSENVRENLVEHLDTLTGGRKNIKVFVPLCGKSVDMKWLSEKGHTVVGVECSEMAIREFFIESQMEYDTHEVSKGTLFKSLDGRIRLYKMDLMDFNRDIEGLFDAIWDKNSLVAMNKQDRKQYASIITSLMSSDCNYLLEVFFYDCHKFTGPPHDVSESDLQSLFGDICDVTTLDTRDITSDKHRGWGLDCIQQILYHLRLKSS